MSSTKRSMPRESGAAAALTVALSVWPLPSGCGPEPSGGASERLDVSERRGVAASAGAADKKPGDRRPNILMIMADDLGYSDIGAFGGEIHTPNLDRLAAKGVVMTEHHATAACSPTRASLISGTDHHLVGLGTMAELIMPEQLGRPGYEGFLNQRSLSIAELLRDAGYHTYIAGKWHLGTTEPRSPRAWGFESSFVLAQGAASHFAPDPARLTFADVAATYREDGYPANVPPDFFSTDFYTDRLLAFLEANEQDGKPFFAFAAYTAPHWPLQAPNAYLDRYRGAYDAGYDAIRARRIARQKALGIIPADFEPAAQRPSTPQNPGWDALTHEQRRVEARRMEVYAAMVDNLDHNIGRLLDYLERTGRLEDTFVFFQSDNGAEGGPTGFLDGATSDNGLDNLGRRYSNVAYGQRWAEVSAAPFRLWKAYATEGGITVPALALLPRGRRAGARFNGLTHVTDLAPTFLELAGVPAPGATYKGRSVHPITGTSLLDRLEGRARRASTHDQVVADELFGRRYVRRDRWKLLWVEPPHGRGDWALHDLSHDRAESRDVSLEHPDVVTALRGEWNAYAARVGLILPSVPGVPGKP